MTRVLFACSITVAMLMASLASVSVLSSDADARGPIYGGPQTTGAGPAFFGPAPNPYPYCDNPTYFDPFPENVSPIGRMDVGDMASVTTEGTTLDLEITAEGNPGTQYPGFFPSGGEGANNDRAKGIELAEGDTAVVRLSQPLFYSQWTFTDVDQPAEGFTVVPTWTEPGEAAAFGGNEQFTFAGTTVNSVKLDDLDGVSHASELIDGRVQVDFLGAVTGITMTRTSPSSGQSGFTVGGGCRAVGAAKTVISGPTWNGTSFDVTYGLRMRNNLPSGATVREAVRLAEAAAGRSFLTGEPQGIPLTGLSLTDDLSDPAFSSITVTSLTNPTGGLALNSGYDGIDDIQLLGSGASMTAESEQLIVLEVEYTPNLDLDAWARCRADYRLLNQTEMAARAANVGVGDLSDNGIDPGPNAENEPGTGVDDPTPVAFPCIPAGLEIVKTAVRGPNGTCPTFADGVPGDGPALALTETDTVTYCISVRNPGPATATGVVVRDPQRPGDFAIGELTRGATRTVSFDLVALRTTPTRNTATATGTGPTGPLGPVSDTALISVSQRPQPQLEIVKTVVRGPNGTCPAFADGVSGPGTALTVTDGDTVTYCISVRNSGPGTATNVVLTDDQAPQEYAIGSLTTGQSATRSYDIAVTLNTPETNTAFANGSGPDGPLPEVSDPALIDVSPVPEPRLEIVKTAVRGPNGTCPNFAGGTAGLGTTLAVNDRETVTYCISVRNSGPGVATNVVVTDDRVPNPFPIGTLAPNTEAAVITYDVVVSLSTPAVNTATVNGTGPAGPLPPVSDPAQIAVNRLPDPVLEIVKTALRGPNAQCPTFENGVPGQGPAVQFLDTEVVTYCITVRNVGAATATDVKITDAQAPNGFDMNVGTLAPNASATRGYDVVVSAATPTVNTATATGQGPNGAVPSVSDPALIAVSRQPDPVLEIVKTVVKGPNGTCPTFANGVQGDGPALPVLYTETVTYCLSVRNTGGNPATNVTVTDPQAPGVFTVGTLAVGQEVTRSYDVVVSATTPAKNTATVNGSGPNGPVPSDSDTALISPAPQPDPVLAIVKTVVKGPNGTCPSFETGVPGQGTPLDVNFGDTVTYCISIKNTGAGDATDVKITDEQSPASPYDIGGLGSGATRTVKYDRLVNAGLPLLNIATVTGTGPNGPVPQATDDAVIRVPGAASISLIHSVSRADEPCLTVSKDLNSLVADLIGTPFQWCVKITNTGSTPLTDVRLDAAALGFDNLDVLAQLNKGAVLAPLESVTLVVGAQSLPDGGKLSDADVAAKPSDTAGTPLPGRTPVTDADDAEVREASINIETTVVASSDGNCANSVELLQVDSGTAVTWCFVVTNTGTMDLQVTEVSVPGLSRTIPIPEASRTLKVGQSVLVTTSSTATGDQTVEGFVEGKPLDDDGEILDQAPVVKDNDPAAVDTRIVDLAIDKNVSNAGPVPPGTELTYTLVITNKGPDTAAGVSVKDVLPTGLTYKTLPTSDDWTCALAAGGRSFDCLKATPMPNGTSVTLTYLVTVDATAARGAAFVNTATVDSTTPDSDKTNNTDTTRTTTNTPGTPPPPAPTSPPLPDDPGPFTQTPPAPPAAPPDEVLGLVITGASSDLLGLLSALMLTIGTVFLVGSRRSRRENGA